MMMQMTMYQIASESDYDLDSNKDSDFDSDTDNGTIDFTVPDVKSNPPS